MTGSNGWSNEKEDVAQVKAPVYNVSTVTNENEWKDSTKRYTQFSP